MRFHYLHQLPILFGLRFRRNSDPPDNHGASPVGEEITNIQPIVCGNNTESRRLIQGISPYPYEPALLKFILGAVPDEDDEATNPDIFFDAAALIKEKDLPSKRKTWTSFQGCVRITFT